MANYQAHRSFGTISSIQIEAQGGPGKRTFRLFLESGVASACLWLEKEQLQQLAIYIKEIGEALSGEADEGGEGSPESPWSGEAISLEFKVGDLSMGHDDASNSFIFLARDVESDDDSSVDLSFWVPLNMARELSKEALSVCAAGRPRCFLCNQPINPEGHMCVRSNGHQTFQS